MSGSMPGSGGSAAMRVEAVAEGTRVTFRAGGLARFIPAAFLACWLVGWLAGELAALGVLLQLFGVSLPLPFSFGEAEVAGGFAVGAGLFLLFWLAFWTLGGFMALGALLALLFGHERFLVRPGGWTRETGVGLWRRRREHGADDVRRVYLRPGGGALMAGTSRGAEELTTAGSEADRRWLGEQLARAVGLPLAAEDEAPAASAAPRVAAWEPAELPAGWVARPGLDGRLALTRTKGHRLAQAGCMLLFALFWNGIVSVFVAGGIAALGRAGRSGGAMDAGNWGYWLFLTPFVAVGLALAWGVLWSALGRETWRVSRSLLEVERAFPGYRRTRPLAGGTLALEVRKDSEGNRTWSLVVEGAGERQTLAGDAEAELRTLGEWLSYHTGWPLRVAAGPTS